MGKRTRFTINVVQVVEEVYTVEADDFEDACAEAEEEFRSDLNIPSYYGDYTTEVINEEEIEDEDDDD